MQLSQTKSLLISETGVEGTGSGVRRDGFELIGLLGGFKFSFTSLTGFGVTGREDSFDI